MCGIAGLYQFDHQPIDPSLIRRMADLIRHRGPDDEGFALFNTQSNQSLHLKGPDSPEGVPLPDIRTVEFASHNGFNLALAERRLAILDLSPAGHTPMVSGNRRFTITFNGEIYNYIELRSELQQLGHTFRSSGDTEVLLAAYEQWGVACVKRFNGMWAFAIWDAQEKKLFCSRDRFGVKPFYYVQQAYTFAFASEPKALWRSGLVDPRPNEKLLGDFLAGYEASALDETIYHNIRQLPAGHHLTIDGGRTEARLQIQRYWSLPVNSELGPRNLDEKVFQTVREKLFDAVRLRLRADVPVGSCLSGGIDSSSIVCIVNQLMQGEYNIARSLIGDHQKTFTASYVNAAEADESHFAKMVIDQTGAAWHQTFPTGERLSAELEKFLWHFDEPPITSSPYAQWCVMQKVREQGVKVVLDGQGADELLAGYLPYDVYFSHILRSGQIGRLLKEIRATSAVGSTNTSTMLQRALVFQLPPALQRKFQESQHQRMVGVRKEVVQAAVERQNAKFEVLYRRNLSEHSRAIALFNLPRLLCYEDRNSMAASIEARTPFLDVQYAEYVSQLPASYRIHAGWSKYVLRQAMSPILPQAIAWRRDKKGFVTPERTWIEGLRQQFVALFQEQPRLSNYLDLTVVRQVLQQPELNRSPIVSATIWRWGAAEMWLRMLESSL